MKLILFYGRAGLFTAAAGILVYALWNWIGGNFAAAFFAAGAILDEEPLGFRHASSLEHAVWTWRLYGTTLADEYLWRWHEILFFTLAQFGSVYLVGKWAWRRVLERPFVCNRTPAETPL